MIFTNTTCLWPFLFLSSSKTLLVNQIQKPLEVLKGYLIHGKFEKMKRPDSVLFSALDLFFGKIINDGDVSLRAQMKLSIANAIGNGMR